MAVEEKSFSNAASCFTQTTDYKNALAKSHAVST